MNLAVPWPTSARVRRAGHLAGAAWRGREAWWLVAAAMLLATVPYLYLAMRISAPGHFSGFVFLVDDGYAALERLASGARGEWLWVDHYTTEGYGGILVFTPTLAAGHLARLLHVPSLLAFHLLRVAGAGLLAAALIAFARWWAPRDWVPAAVLLYLGSGLGWLSGVLAAGHLLGFVPFDLAAPESSALYTSLHRPDYELTSAVLVFTFLAFRKPTLRSALLSGIAIWLAVTVHPQMALVMLAVLALEAWLRSIAGADYPSQTRTRLRLMSLWAVIWAPYILYAAWLQLNSPLLQAWSQAWVNWVPSPLSYLLGLGLWVPLAILGTRRLLARDDDRVFGPLAWVAVSLLMLYLPMPARSLHRSLDAAHLPWMALGFAWLWPRLAAAAAPRRVAAGALLCLTSLLLLTVPLTGFAVTNSTIAGTTWQALQALRADALARPGRAVLSGRSFGLYAPVWAGVDAYDGQVAETLNVMVKDASVRDFFDGSRHWDRAAFLRRNHIAWVYEGAYEHAAAGSHEWVARSASACASPAQCALTPRLSLLWSSGGQSLYRVVSPAQP